MDERPKSNNTSDGNVALSPFTLGQVLTGKYGSSEEGCTFVVTSLDPLLVKPEAINAFWSSSRLRDYSYLRNTGIGLLETYVGGEWTCIFNHSTSVPWFIFYRDGTFCHYR